MSHRGSVGILVLAVLIAPAASARGLDMLEDAYSVAAEHGVDLPAAPAPVASILADAPEPSAQAPNVFVDGSREAPSEPQEPPSETSRADDSPSSGGSRSSPAYGSLPRLVPVPALGHGAVPKVDLGLVGTGRILSPLLPPAPAPASAPAASQPSAVVAPAAAATPAEEADALPAGALVAVAAAASAAAPALPFGWERLRRFALVAALYTRIARERLLDHGSRDLLLSTIRERPGLAVADLAKATGTPRNTVTYHLRVLEREGLVSSTRNGRNRLFFAPGSLEKRSSADALAALRHETSRAIAVEVGVQPGLDQQTLCQKFGLQPSLAHWHADRLVTSGIVEKRREGRRVRYYPGASFALVAGFIPAVAPREAPAGSFTTSA